MWQIRARASGMPWIRRLRARWRRSPHSRLHRLGRVLAAVAFVLVCHVGGTVATDTFPVQVDTDHYSMRASLDLAPWRWSQLRAFTTVGDVTLDFRTVLPTPGVEVSPQIKKSILGSVGGGFSTSSLVPDPSEIRDAGVEAVVGLLVTYIVGASVAAAIALLATHTHWTQHRRRALLGGGCAVLVALVYTAGSAVATYRPSRVGTYSSTQLLALLQSSPQVLTNIEKRAGQVEPYITNWLELQQALQEQFVAPEVAKADTVRFLLVSDIHGTNEYKTMKTIVKNEDITAVIDTGDLLNFGRVDEAELAGIFTGIASLKVPYIFVTGNHDASSPNDPRPLLTRLAQVRNVILPEPAIGDYRVVSIAGVRIAGMDDPRYFGDSNTDPSAVEAPAADKFDAALKDVPDLDIALAHEPTATEKIDVGALRIHGHLHRATLDGNVIGVGSFTGGGLVSYYRNSIAEGDAEPTGQPQEFDILRYNADCSVNSLQRFTYSDLLEGSPRYDRISIINGASLPGPKPAEGRRCVTTEPTKDMTVAEAINTG